MRALARRNPSQTDTAAFRRWFGASKVVDGQGQPLVVYHGTTAGGFDAFRPNYRKGEQLGFGIHFAQDRDFAAKYAEDPTVARRGKTPKVYAVYLSIQRPLVSDAIVHEGTPEFALAKKLAGSRLMTQRNEDGVRMAYMQNAIDQTTAQRAEKLIREAGYDGIVYEAQLASPTGYGWAKTGSSRSFIVFDPTQVKSATDNAGTFDPADPSILRNPRRRGLDVRPGIEGTYLTRYTAKGGGKRAYPTQGGAAWDRTLVRVANETTAPSGRVYDTVKRAERMGRATVRGKRGAVEVLRVTNPARRNPSQLPVAHYAALATSLRAADRAGHLDYPNDRDTALRAWASEHGVAFLGAGMHRVVFRVPEGALKLSLKPVWHDRLYGNLAEARVWDEAPPLLRKHLVPILAVADDGAWLLQEYAPTTGRERTPKEQRNVDAMWKAMARCGYMDFQGNNIADDGRLLDYGSAEYPEMWKKCVARGAAKKANPAPDAEPLVLYHGAQRWEGPPSIVAHRKGHAEHGAGIYLTTSWTTASNYAKGGGSVYRFEVAPDVGWLEDARLPVAETVRWVKSLPRLKGKADIVATLERVAGRVGPSIPAETLVAAFVNFGASAGQHGPSLAEYLVAQGIDASHVSRSGEDWVVVFNPAKVLRVTRVPARDMGEGFVFDLPRVKRKNPSRHRNPPSRLGGPGIAYDVGSIVDTRHYERDATGRYRPVPGSGEHRPCDNCDKDHVVHVVIREKRPYTEASLSSMSSAQADFVRRSGLLELTGKTYTVGRDCAEMLTGNKISQTAWDAAAARAKSSARRRNPRAACPTKLMKYEYLGTTDEVTTCDCCGKTNLKNTVAIRDLDEGEVLHFGVTCAARALKVQVADVKKGAADADRQRRAEEMHRRYEEDRARAALWQEWLIERTGGIYEYDRSPDVFRMLQALGGVAAARVGFEEWKAAKKARSNPRRGGRR